MGKRKKTGGGEKKENAERTKRIRGLCPFRSVLYQKRLILIYFYRTDAYTVIPSCFVSVVRKVMGMLIPI